MIEALAEFFALAPEYLPPIYLVFLRVGAAMALLPAFGEQMVPLRVRLAATVAFTMIVAPAVWQTHETPSNIGFAYVMVEVGMGLALGFALRLQVMALQVAASVAAQVTSLSQLLGGSAVEPQPALGAVLFLAALALAAQLGLHVQYAAMIINSYEIVGFGGTFASADFGLWAVRGVSSMFGFALLLAMPFVAVSLLYNLALGVINRAMPQLMVAFVGAPAITFGALVMMALSAPVILIVWLKVFKAALIAPFGVH